MEPIGKIIPMTMRNVSSAHEDKPEPEPLYCIFCRSELRYRPLMNPFFKNRVFMWQTPEPCICPKSQLHTAQYNEKMRRIEEERQAREAEKERIRRVERLFSMSKLPERFKNRTFDNFLVTPENEAAYRIALDYAFHFEERKKEGQGLLFSGKVGTGKTHLAAAISLYLLNRCTSVIFGTVTNLLGRIKDTYSEDSELDEQEVIDQFCNVSLLVLDDLGKEKPTLWVEQMVYEIINTRYENNMPIVVTTNVGLKDIRDIYPKNGAAIESRLVEICRGVKMDGTDFRKKRLMG